MDVLGSKYQQLGLPPAERLALPEFATDKNEFVKARQMILTAIRKQVKKGRKNGKGSIAIRPCYSPGIIPGYALSKRRSTAIYSRAAMHLKAEGFISEIGWTRRKGKRVIDSIVAKCPSVDRRTQNCAAPDNKKKAKPTEPKKKPSSAFNLLLKNRDLPPWVHRWAKKLSSPSSNNSALLIDAYFELISQSSYIHERTLACYAFGDSKSGGNIGKHLASIFRCNCPCMKDALASCSNVWQQIEMLGIERTSGTVMISGPIEVHGCNGETFNASMAGGCGLGVTESVLIDTKEIDVSRAQGCLVVENEACFQYASCLLHERVVIIYCLGQPSLALVGFVRRLNDCLAYEAPRCLWLDIDAASLNSADRFIAAIPSFQTLMMGSKDFLWLQESHLLRKPNKEKLSEHDHQVLNGLEQRKLASGIDKSLVRKLHANVSAEQEAFIGEYAFGALMAAFPESKNEEPKTEKCFNFFGYLKRFCQGLSFNDDGLGTLFMSRRRRSANEQDA